MALKGDRVVIETDISWTCDTATERGVVLVMNTSGSGVALGDSAGEATRSANPSGKKVLGVLLGDVVDVDTTRYHLNFHKDEQKLDENVTLLRKGQVTTNMIHTGFTPAYGDTAYLTSSGQLTNTLSSTGGLAQTPKVGLFVSSKDANGYAKVDINLPIV
jgi:hypothetical protein